MTIDISSPGQIEMLLLQLIKDGSSEDPDCSVLPETVPNRDIKGFDSLTALEVLTELEEQTGIHVEEEIFYLDVKPRKYRSVHEVALAIWNEHHIGGTTP